MMSKIQGPMSRDAKGEANRPLPRSLLCVVLLELDKVCYGSTCDGHLTGRGDSHTVLKHSQNCFLIKIEFLGSVALGKECTLQARRCKQPDPLAALLL